MRNHHMLTLLTLASGMCGATGYKQDMSANVPDPPPDTVDWDHSATGDSNKENRQVVPGPDLYLRHHFLIPNFKLSKPVSGHLGNTGFDQRLQQGFIQEHRGLLTEDLEMLPNARAMDIQADPPETLLWDKPDLDSNGTTSEGEVIGRSNKFNLHVAGILLGDNDQYAGSDNGNWPDPSVIQPGRVNETSGIAAKDPRDCCLIVFVDGSAFYFDDFLRKLTGFYRIMYGTVNGYPHYVAQSCNQPDVYDSSCTYLWHSRVGWVIGVGQYIGQTKGVIYNRQKSLCPMGHEGWRYLSHELEWRDNGAISIICAS